jgi:hypothetical protein
MYQALCWAGIERGLSAFKELHGSVFYDAYSEEGPQRRRDMNLGNNLQIPVPLVGIPCSNS